MRSLLPESRLRGRCGAVFELSFPKAGMYKGCHNNQIKKGIFKLFFRATRAVIIDALTLSFTVQGGAVSSKFSF